MNKNKGVLIFGIVDEARRPVEIANSVLKVGIVPAGAGVYNYPYTSPEGTTVNQMDPYFGRLALVQLIMGELTHRGVNHVHPSAIFAEATRIWEDSFLQDKIRGYVDDFVDRNEEVLIEEDDEE